MKKIFIMAYAKKNLGDDLFIHVLAKRYMNTRFYLCAKTRYTSKCFNVSNLKLIRPSIIRSLDKLSFNLNNAKYNSYNLTANKCNAMVFIGGSMFMQGSDIATSKKMLEDRFSHLKKGYYIMGSNFGPYEDQEYLDMYKEVFKKAKDVCFREEYSYNLFKDVDTVRYAADIVFSMDVSNIEKEKTRRVIISVIDLSFRKGLDKYTEVYERKIKDTVEYFLHTGYNVTLMSFCDIEGDEKVIDNILELVEDKSLVDVYRYDGNLKEALEVISHSSIVIAARFHAMILGLLFNKTVIPMVYSDKTLHVMDDIDFKGKYVMIEDIESFDISSFSDEDLYYEIDVSKQIIDANRHFEKLDVYLNGK